MLPKAELAGLGKAGVFDIEFYSASETKYAGFEAEVVDGGGEEDEDDDTGLAGGSHPSSLAAAREASSGADAAALEELKATRGSGLINTRIADREDEVRGACVRGSLARAWGSVVLGAAARCAARALCCARAGGRRAQL